MGEPASGGKKEPEKEPSCATLYVGGCQLLNIKPKQSVMKLLPKSPGLFTMTEINIGTDYLGDKGVRALLRVIDANVGLTRLNFRNTGLTNVTVVEAVKVFVKHPSLTSVDLSGNVDLAIDAGLALLKLAKQNTQILRLGMTGTRISKDLQQKIKTNLTDNRKNISKNKDIDPAILLKKRKTLNIHELQVMSSIFHKLDIDKDGQVDYEEFKAAYSDLTTNEPLPDYLPDIFTKVDKNNDGKLDLLEYCKAAFPTIPTDDLKYYIDTLSQYYGDRKPIKKEYNPIDELTAEEQKEITTIFSMYDEDGDGFLSVKELKSQLGKSWIVADVDEIFSKADIDGDSKLSLNEFMTMMVEYYVS